MPSPNSKRGPGVICNVPPISSIARGDSVGEALVLGCVLGILEVPLAMGWKLGCRVCADAGATLCDSIGVWLGSRLAPNKVGWRLPVLSGGRTLEGVVLGKLLPGKPLIDVGAVVLLGRGLLCGVGVLVLGRIVGHVEGSGLDPVTSMKLGAILSSPAGLFVGMRMALGRRVTSLTVLLGLADGPRLRLIDGEEVGFRKGLSVPRVGWRVGRSIISGT